MVNSDNFGVWKWFVIICCQEWNGWSSPGGIAIIRALFKRTVIGPKAEC